MERGERKDNQPFHHCICTITPASASSCISQVQLRPHGPTSSKVPCNSHLPGYGSTASPNVLHLMNPWSKLVVVMLL